MTKYLMVFVLSLASLSMLFGQAPDWVDPAKRTSSWPSNQFLSAYATEALGKNASQMEVQGQLNNLVKNQISESIMVSVNAQTEMQVSVQNAATDQSLKRSSITMSEANLVGLKTENYFDAKKKVLYAFAYLSIDDFARYNQSLIIRNEELITQNLNGFSQLSKNDQIERVIENKKYIREIDQAVRVLQALNKPNPADLGQLRQLASKTGNAMASIFSNGQVTAGHIAKVLAGEIGLGLQEGRIVSVRSAEMTYANAGLASGFSNEIMKQLVAGLSQNPLVAMSTTATGLIFGNFRNTSDAVIFSASLVDDKNNTEIAYTLSISPSNIQTGGQPLLPANFEMIGKLPEVVLSVPATYASKPTGFLSNPIKINCAVGNQPIGNLKLTLDMGIKAKENPFSLLTDESGTAIFTLNEKWVKPGMDYEARISLDLAGYLGLDSRNPFLVDLLATTSFPTRRIEINVIAPTIFVQSKEMGINEPVPVKLIEPAVKSGLSGLNYKFVDKPELADYLITIDAVARKGPQGDFAVSFVDASISMTDLVSGKEMYKNSFANIKGVGAGADDAQAKAFQKARSMVADDISYQLEFGRK